MFFVLNVEKVHKSITNCCIFYVPFMCDTGWIDWKHLELHETPINYKCDMPAVRFQFIGHLNIDCRTSNAMRHTKIVLIGKSASTVDTIDRALLFRLFLGGGIKYNRLPAAQMSKRVSFMNILRLINNSSVIVWNRWWLE